MKVKRTLQQKTSEGSLFTCGSGQTYVLEALIASFIIIGAAFFMVNSVSTQGSRIASFSSLQLKTYADDILTILSVEKPKKIESLIDVGNHTSLLYDCVNEGVNGNWTEFNNTFDSIGSSLRNLSILYNVEVLKIEGNHFKVIARHGYSIGTNSVSSFKVLIIRGKVYEVKLTLWYV